MANILTNSSAPYVLVLLVSSVGWLISNTYDDLQKTHIISYIIEYDRKKSENHGAIVSLTTYSQLAEPVIGQLRFKCISPDGRSNSDIECFDKDRPARAVSTSFLDANPKAPSLQLKRFVTQLTSSYGTSVSYLLPLVDEKYEIRMEYDLTGDNQGKRILVTDDNDVRVWVLVYFVPATIFAFISLATVLVVTIAGGVMMLLRSGKSGVEQENGDDKVSKFWVTVAREDKT